MADSSPVISLARIGRLVLLRALYGRVLVPSSVYEEVVVDGRRLHKAGVQEVEEAITSGWIGVAHLTRAQLETVATYITTGGIGRGEAAAMVLAKSRRLAVVIDDKNARELAQTLGLEYVGTAAVLLDAFFRGLLDKKDFYRSLEDLSRVSWLSPEVVTKLLQLVEEGP
ncbi:MAG: hypothetical protein HYY01_00340 [Chloroflexi bacterium]|nr:hypothetical protein [Chloroflexota bacterium]